MLALVVLSAGCLALEFYQCFEGKGVKHLSAGGLALECWHWGVLSAGGPALECRHWWYLSARECSRRVQMCFENVFGRVLGWVLGRVFGRVFGKLFEFYI